MLNLLSIISIIDVDSRTDQKLSVHPSLVLPNFCKVFSFL